MHDMTRKEAETVGCLDHPNIIKLIKSKAYPNPFDRRLVGYFTMQFEICQKSLHNFIKENQQNGTLNETCISDNLLKQIGGAVKYLHHLRIVHHDIKPDNVMVVNDLVPRNELQFKLIDFGLAIRYSPYLPITSMRDNRYMGTPLYMSEQKLECHANRRMPSASYNPYLADVFALGFTLIQCAMGYEAPVPNNPTLNIRNAILQRMVNKILSVDHMSDLVRASLIHMLQPLERNRSQMHEILR